MSAHSNKYQEILRKYKTENSNNFAYSYINKMFIFLELLDNFKFFIQSSPPDPKWKLFATMKEAKEASYVCPDDFKLDLFTLDVFSATNKLIMKAGRQSITEDFLKAAQEIVWIKAKAASRSATNDQPKKDSKKIAREFGRCAVRSAKMIVSAMICNDLNLDSKHKEFIVSCWNVWQKGYALYCDVDGDLYVFEKIV